MSAPSAFVYSDESKIVGVHCRKSDSTTDGTDVTPLSPKPAKTDDATSGTKTGSPKSGTHADCSEVDGGKSRTSGSRKSGKSRLSGRSGYTKKSADGRKSHTSTKQDRQNIEVKFQQQFWKTALCTKAMNGACHRGEHCQFAHSPEELRIRPNLDKTKLCPDGSSCRDEQCKYAHSREELTATRNFAKTKVCHFGDKCLNGDKCRFAHSTQEINGRSSAPTIISLTKSTASTGITRQSDMAPPGLGGPCHIPLASRIDSPYDSHLLFDNQRLANVWARKLMWDAYYMDTLFLANRLLYF